jgi:hypothetical protein
MKSDKATTVELGDEALLLADLRANSMLFSRAFEEARKRGHGICLCGAGRLQLKITRQFVSKTDRTVCGYALSRWPTESGEHGELCFFRKTGGQEGGGDADVEPAIQEEEDGTVDVQGDFSLNERVHPGDATGGRTGGGTGASTSRRGAPLLSFLFKLWEDAQLTDWRAGWSRDWSRVQFEAWKTLARMRLNGYPARERVFVPQEFRRAPAAAAKAFDAFWNPIFDQAVACDKVLAEKDAEPKRVGMTWPLAIVIGVVKSIGDDPSIRLWQFRKPLYTSRAELDRLRTRFPKAFDGDAPAPHNIGIFLVRPTARGHLRLVSAAMSLATAHYVLVESSLEAQVATALCDANRSFSKPLLLGEERYRPDFLLYDAGGPPVYMEVYGITGDPEYDMQKAEKRAYYTARGVPTWEWDLSVTREMPAPPARR